MPHMISLLSDAPEPNASKGEKVLMLHLSKGPQGFRMRAQPSQSDRVVARWISECPLAITETALLWASRYGWTTQSAPDGIDLQKVLDTVPKLTPNQPGVHPQDVFAMMLQNLPQKDPSSPETGAVIQLKPQRPPAALIEGPVASRPSRPARAPVEKPRLDGEAREMAVGLRELIGMLVEGATPEEIRETLADQWGLAPSAPPEVAEEEDDEGEGDVDLAALLEDLDDEEDGDDDEGAADVVMVEGIPHVIARDANGRPVLVPQPSPPPPQVVPRYAGPIPPPPPGYRALQPGEKLPGLTPEQQEELDQLGAGTDGLRGKIERGRQHDEEKYLRHVPPLNAQQQKELEDYQAEVARRHAAALAAGARPETNGHAGPALLETFPVDDEDLGLDDDDAPPIPLRAASEEKKPARRGGRPTPPANGK